ncbi:sigma-54 interaction domain-containing protein [Salipaludibacillus sp. CF4.18]|uniref:sigma-54 interaction domain-containing protein n=1 Tax=Salipaludibacillus sp. CF4.18 TaxID=3373081 RepID=UPI003EE68FD4
MLNIDFDLKKFENLADFDHILVADKNGIIIFYDVGDLNVLKELGIRPEEFLGKNVKAFYKHFTDENSTVMNVLATGTAQCNVRQDMLTNDGNKIISQSSTYPIKENDKIVGAIEFSSRLFAKENIQSLDKLAGHKLFRKNNTIFTIDDIITVNETMEAIKKKINNIAKTNSTVLINGRTGTGKEVVAQAIHNLSDRYAKPFISLNCSAIPASLMESTLFGTMKGSFTGSEDMPGLFEQANGGTLFLDEINSLDIYLQAKLLKVIEEKAIRRIGGKESLSLDIRIISATNEEPNTLLDDKRLREDLFYRLGVVQIDLPNLTERMEDIEVLVESFINFYNNNMNIVIANIDREVLDSFKRYHWPGNVRELKNAIEMAYNHVSSNQITINDVPRRIVEFTGKTTVQRKNVNINSLKDAVDGYEKEIIVNILSTGGKIAESARRLGISKQSLKYKMDKYHLR